MRVVECPDGTVKVVELDPTKWYWLVIDRDAGIRPENIRKRDGTIIFKNPGTELTFIENADRVDGPQFAT